MACVGETGDSCNRGWLQHVIYLQSETSWWHSHCTCTIGCPTLHRKIKEISELLQDLLTKNCFWSRKVFIVL